MIRLGILLAFFLGFSGVAYAGPIKIVGIIQPDDGLSISEQIGAASLGGKPIEVEIDSPGGSFEASESIAFALKLAQLNKSRVTCTVTGRANSGAAIIFEMGCGVRVMRPGATLLFHEPSLYIPKASTLIKLRVLRQLSIGLEALNQHIAGEIAPRLNLTPAQYLSRISDREWVLTAEEAIRSHASDKVTP